MQLFNLPNFSVQAPRPRVLNTIITSWLGTLLLPIIVLIATEDLLFREYDTKDQLYMDLLAHGKCIGVVVIGIP